jgi:multidrug efflux pump
MLLMGFSINLLTLLAMVLAIGLVVDDAIVVVENVHRHIEMGKPKIQAAIDGGAGAGPAHHRHDHHPGGGLCPHRFHGGLVGTLFTEFAFTLAGAVLVSGVVALTLSPMLSALVLRAGGEQTRFERGVEHVLRGPGPGLRGDDCSMAGRYPSTTLLVALVVIGSIYAMYSMTKKELAPTEDQSILFFMATPPRPPPSTMTCAYAEGDAAHLRLHPRVPGGFLLAGFGGDQTMSFGGFKMPPAAERERSQMRDPAGAPGGQAPRSPGSTPWSSRGPACRPRATGSRWSSSSSPTGATRSWMDSRTSSGRRHGQRQVHVPAEGS